MRSLWVILNLIVSVVIIPIPILLGGWFDKNKNVTAALSRFWGRWVLWSTGVSWEIEGLEKLEKTGQYIFMSNHSSALDIILGVALLPYNLVFLAKKELFIIPLFGWAMAAAGMIRIDRGNPEKAKSSVNKASQTLSESPFSTLMYPEGTRSKTGELLPFKKGGFIMAIQADLPVVPLTIIGAGNILPKGAFRMQPGRVKIIAADPLHTKELSSADKNQLLNSCRNIIQTQLHLHKGTASVTTKLHIA